MQEASTTAALNTRVYIDGYNFYYGCLKGTPWKWLDLTRLFEQSILPSILYRQNGLTCQAVCIQPAIRYFTASILEKAAKAGDSVSSQERYHTALRKLYADRIEVIKGYYALNEASAKQIDPNHPDVWPRDCPSVQVWKLEEKQSDVNLALHAYHDSLTGAVDMVVLVTNDTDIAPAMDMIRRHTSVIIGLVVPTTDHKRIPNTELADRAHWVRTHITRDELARSQLPRVIPGRRPTIKPMSWYARPDLLTQVLDVAATVTGSRGEAFKWVEKPNPWLDGQAPVDLVETPEGAERVMAYMRAWMAGPSERGK
jgi:6-hydroxy-3-succinoylpyridine 3-monooxygenase